MIFGQIFNELNNEATDAVIAAEAAIQLSASPFQFAKSLCVLGRVGLIGVGGSSTLQSLRPQKAEKRVFGMLLGVCRHLVTRFIGLAAINWGCIRSQADTNPSTKNRTTYLIAFKF